MRKKIFPFITIVMFLSNALFSQNWEYAQSAGGSGNDHAKALVADSAGNTYVVGTFKNTMHFGTSPITLTSAGYEDCFIAKYDPAGIIVWAKRFGGSGVDEATDIVLSGTALSVTGDFVGTACIDGDTLAANGGSDFFLLKLDAATGNLIFARSYGGPDDEIGSALAADSAGAVYLTGTFATNLTLGSTTLVSFGNDDVFISKFDGTLGNPLWAVSGGCPSVDCVFTIAATVEGECYVAGTFGGSLQANSAIFGTDTLASAGHADGFLLKYDASGIVLWARQIGGSWYENVAAVCLGPSGTIVVAGSFPQGTTSFGQHVLSTTSSTSGFIALYDQNGADLWVNKISGYNLCYGVTCDHSGRVHVIGTFADTCSFGLATLVSTANRDVFVTVLDQSGAFCEALQCGGTDNQDGAAIALDATGGRYISGDFYGQAMLCGTMSAANINTLGTSQDIFIAKLSTSPSAVAATEVSLNMQVYPCPFVDQCMVAFSEKGDWRVELYDLLGNCVMQMETADSETLVLDRGNLPAGAYCLVAFGRKGEEASLMLMAK